MLTEEGVAPLKKRHGAKRTFALMGKVGMAQQ